MNEEMLNDTQNIENDEAQEFMEVKRPDLSHLPDPLVTDDLNKTEPIEIEKPNALSDETKKWLESPEVDEVLKR